MPSHRRRRTATSTQSPDSPTRRTAKKWWPTARSMGLAVLAALLFRALVAEAYVIPSGSMEPSLLVGDRLVVSKCAYGLRVPFSDLWLVRGEDPQRGDVVVFRDPQGGSDPLIKRVVAVGGDRVEMRDNVVHVNGEPLPRQLMPGPCWTEGQRCERYLELRRAGPGHVVQQLPDHLPWSMPELIVPEGHLFFLGDNRDQSNDSRFWGTVPVTSVRGKALLVFWSSGPDGLRTERFGRPVR
jgi:signal peptidase I